MSISCSLLKPIFQLQGFEINHTAVVSNKSTEFFNKIQHLIEVFMDYSKHTYLRRFVTNALICQFTCQMRKIVNDSWFHKLGRIHRHEDASKALLSIHFFKVETLQFNCRVYTKEGFNCLIKKLDTIGTSNNGRIKGSGDDKIY